MTQGAATLYSTEAEQAVLGGLLHASCAGDVEEVTAALQTLRTECFCVPAHRTIFSVIRVLHEKGLLPDPVAVTIRLRETGQLDSLHGQVRDPVGALAFTTGAVFVTGLLHSVFSPVFLPRDVVELRASAARRQAARLGEALIDTVREGRPLSEVTAIAAQICSVLTEATAGP